MEGNLISRNWANAAHLNQPLVLATTRFHKLGGGGGEGRVIGRRGDEGEVGVEEG